MIFETKLPDLSEQGLASIIVLSQATTQTNLLPDTLITAVIVFLIWDFEPSVPILVAMTAAKDMKCASFSNLALFTLLALMNALVTFNAHLSLFDTLLYRYRLSFLFFTPSWAVYLSRIILCKRFSSDWLLFCHVMFLYQLSWKILNSWPRAFAFQVARKSIPFAYLWTHYLHWQRCYNL